MINAGHTWFPPKEKLFERIEATYQNGALTNNGPLIKLLEERLKDYLGVKHLYIVSNATIAIMLALKALKLKG